MKKEINTMAEYNGQKYGRLLSDYLPEVIETEEANEQALAIVERFMRRGENNLSPEEQKLCTLYIRLIEDYEEKAYPEIGAAATPAMVLKSLMEEHGLKQTDLGDIIPQTTISQVLSGKRSISKAQAKKLSQRFNLSVEAFI